MSWYKVTAKATHVGAGTSEQQTIYFWEEGMPRALKYYSRLGAVQHNRTPDIRKLRDEEVSSLKSSLLKERKLSLEEMMRRRTPIRYIFENPPV